MTIWWKATVEDRGTRVTSPTPPPRQVTTTKTSTTTEESYRLETYLNALLADLQNTISPGSPPPLRDIGGATSGYGSLNRPRNDIDTGLYGSLSKEKIHTVQKTSTPTSPVDQQRLINETLKGKGNTPSLNNNLSELDTLLQDLSNSRYGAGSPDRRQNISSGSLERKTNGSALVSTLPTRPSVDSLLEELNTPVPNGTGDLRDVYVRRTYTVTENQTHKRIPIPGEPLPAPQDLPAIAAGGASNATRELDDLMASLSDFKVNAGTHQIQTVTDSPYARPNQATHTRNQLDSMLGNLQADMSRQGVNTAQKGCCQACDKPIVGQVITALGKTWHPEHFTCTHCSQELGTRNFFERDGRPYCENDYHTLFSPRCAYCNGPILDKCVTALDKTWHTEHFFCAQCGKQFGDDGFHERDGKAYCRNDYFDMFAPKCGGCSRPIMENYISALNSQWHTDCFVCRDCKKPVSGKSFYAMEGKPVCAGCVGVDDEEGDDE